MLSFKKFLNESEEEKDVHKTLEKLPQSHRGLVKGFDVQFHGGNTLNGDDEHVGYMDAQQRKIAVAAPYNYSREFTFLHEIAHTLWERLGNDIKERWAEIVKRTKHKQNQSPEELFCMAYANYYAKNKVTIHDHGEWNEFIGNLPK